MWPEPKADCGGQTACSYTMCLKKRLEKLPDDAIGAGAASYDDLEIATKGKLSGQQYAHDALPGPLIRVVRRKHPHIVPGQDEVSNGFGTVGDRHGPDVEIFAKKIRLIDIAERNVIARSDIV